MTVTGPDGDPVSVPFLAGLVGDDYVEVRSGLTDGDQVEAPPGDRDPEPRPGRAATGQLIHDTSPTTGIWRPQPATPRVTWPAPAGDTMSPGGVEWGIAVACGFLRWVRRYAPAEVAATAGALLGAVVGVRLAGPVGAAVGGDLGEGLAFYAVVIVRELRAERSAARPRSIRRLLADLLREFGPAEALDSFALRPLAMFAGPLVTGAS